jgi:hypothetical protein
MAFRMTINGEPFEPSEPLVFIRLLQCWLNCGPGSVLGVFQDQAEKLIASGVAEAAPEERAT